MLKPSTTGIIMKETSTANSLQEFKAHKKCVLLFESKLSLGSFNDIMVAEI
jgi:hypothetical protein